MTNPETPNKEPCPVARSANVLGDRWSLLIVRDAFDGISRFSEFQRSLGVARNILADRLRRLVDDGILQTQSDGNGSAWTLLDFEVARKANLDDGRRLAEMEAARRASSAAFRSAFARDAQACMDAL
ncbi:transcriptional regulator, partial [Halobellus sp. Atlit-31R]